eukprot:s452_g9.t1
MHVKQQADFNKLFSYQLLQAMEVCSALSGETLVLLETDEVEGKSVKTLKQSLAARVGFSRFRQRFLSEDGSRRIPDEEIFESTPVKIQLLIAALGKPEAQQEGMMTRAARDNDSVVLEQLLERPLDPNETDLGGETALHHAARNGHSKPVKLLLEAGADRDATTPGPRLTPLLLATLGGHTHIVHLLIEADPDKEKGHNRQSPLGIAAQKGSLDIASFLNGQTPLWIAAKRGNLDIARLLIKAGADKEKGQINGQTPLGIAAERGNLDIARLLIEAGADTEKGGDCS